MLYMGIDREGQYLVDMLYAPAYTKLCLTAAEMDVFSKLTAPKTARELAAEMGWHEQNTGLFLEALASIRLLQKEGGQYQNSPCSNTYLVRGSERYMGGFMAMYAGLGGFAQTDFAGLVREGPQAAGEEPVSNVSFADQFAAMRLGQTGERAFEVGKLLCGLPEFAGAKRLLDLGCGTGMMGLEAAALNPELQVVLFDTPAMEPGMRESIGECDLEDRAVAVGGDYLTGDIGSGYDIIMAFATLNFAKPVMEDVLRKLHAALRPGGVLIATGDGIHPDGTQPAEMVVGWLAYTMKGMDFRLHSGMIAECALAAGFRNVHTSMVPTCSGPAEINIARK